MTRDIRQAFGLCLALVALVGQLTLAAIVPVSSLSLSDVTEFCHHDGDPGAPAAPAHQSPDCLVCFFCHNATGSVGPIADAPLLPAPTAEPVVRAAILPPATAPPLRIVLSANPRGPPIQA
jgi:hypothetical protein